MHFVQMWWGEFQAGAFGRFAIVVLVIMILPPLAADSRQPSAAARDCFSEMGIEMTAKDVLIALFDSENHRPFSDPASAADLALKRLSDAGYAVVPFEPSNAMIEAGRLGDPLPCDVGAIWRFMVKETQG
jgi:hypothetical protein